MRSAATVFSWLGWVLNAIIDAIIISAGYEQKVITRYSTYYGYSYHTTTQRVPFPVWVWGVWVLIVVLRVFILAWRQAALSNGKKVASGICTLIFVSFIGGILTLCIPESDLGQLYKTKLKWTQLRVPFSLQNILNINNILDNSITHLIEDLLMVGS